MKHHVFYAAFRLKNFDMVNQILDRAKLIFLGKSEVGSGFEFLRMLCTYPILICFKLGNFAQYGLGFFQP